MQYLQAFCKQSSENVKLSQNDSITFLQCAQEHYQDYYKTQDLWEADVVQTNNEVGDT